MPATVREPSQVHGPPARARRRVVPVRRWSCPRWQGHSRRTEAGGGGAAFTPRRRPRHRLTANRTRPASPAPSTSVITRAQRAGSSDDYAGELRGWSGLTRPLWRPAGSARALGVASARLSQRRRRDVGHTGSVRRGSRRPGGRADRSSVRLVARELRGDLVAILERHPSRRGQKREAADRATPLDLAGRCGCLGVTLTDRRQRTAYATEQLVNAGLLRLPALDPPAGKSDAARLRAASPPARSRGAAPGSPPGRWPRRPRGTSFRAL